MKYPIQNLPLLLFVLLSLSLAAQEVGIGTTAPSARLHVEAPAAYANPLLKVVTGANTHLTVLADGKVGIATAAPLARLHIENDGMVLARGAYNSGISLPVSGAMTALIWYPRKAAFRAGEVTGTEWDNAQIGHHSSVGGGLNNVASGYYSVVSGGSNNSAIQANTAIGGGENNSAGGYAATVGGGNTNSAGGTYAPSVGGAIIR